MPAAAGAGVATAAATAAASPVGTAAPTPTVGTLASGGFEASAEPEVDVTVFVAAAARCLHVEYSSRMAESVATRARMAVTIRGTKGEGIDQDQSKLYILHIVSTRDLIYYNFRRVNG